jgi:bacteriocin-like protein
MRDQSDEVMRELSDEEMKHVSGGAAGGVSNGNAYGQLGIAPAKGVRGNSTDGTGPGKGNGVALVG